MRQHTSPQLNNNPNPLAPVCIMVPLSLSLFIFFFTVLTKSRSTQFPQLLCKWSPSSIEKSFCGDPLSVDTEAVFPGFFPYTHWMNDYEALLNTRRHCNAPKSRLKSFSGHAQVSMHVGFTVHLSICIFCELRQLVVYVNPQHETDPVLLSFNAQLFRV